jgi:hypothetical protein
MKMEGDETVRVNLPIASFALLRPTASAGAQA